MKDKNKKQIIGLVAGVILLVVIVLTAAYAYFVAQTGAGAKTNVNVTAETTDSLSFTTGDPINIEATMENFSEGKENRTGSTSATAILIAGKDSTPSYDYNVYLDISSNTFVYTTEESTPELILKVTGPDNQPYKTIEGLTYNETIGGYDITKAEGLIRIASNYNITTTTTIEQTWNIEVTLVNLNSNQNLNLSKEFNSELIIQQEEITPTLASYIKATALTDDALLKHDVNLENGAGDNSYRYSGANPDNYVCFGSDEAACPEDNLYRITGVFNDLIVDEDGNDTGEKEYRVKLIKADIANSDILGTDGDYSPNTYSKSGLTNYKGNKETINRYYWNKKNYSLSKTETGKFNIWSYSELNKTNLNKNYISYLNKIDTKWADMIETTKWSVGGMAWEDTTTAKQYYTEEINYATSYVAKIGLMYVSDYGYAASPENWTIALHYYNGATIINNNWMCLEIYELTISRHFSNPGLVFYVNAGSVYGSATASLDDKAVRPSFYLKSSINYTGGTGTSTDPFRIN